MAQAIVLLYIAYPMEGPGRGASTFSASGLSIVGFSQRFRSVAMSFGMSHMSQKHTDFNKQIRLVKTRQQAHSSKNQ